MQLNSYFKRERGRLARVARETGLNPGYLSQVASGVKELAPWHVPAIERACSFEVRRWDLRPRDWRQIWPEAANDPAAPAPERMAANG